VNGGVVHTTGDITNSTFVGNPAVSGLGGAMAIQATGAVTLENVTIANNPSTCNGVCFASVFEYQGDHIFANGFA
jgi:acyl CoA:acetate/3-ketoacid CoA transferase beta subunit